MRKQLLFQRSRTVTPGGHPGGGITVTSRGDGIIVRIIDQDGDHREVYLPTEDVENLVEMLTDDPRAWGWHSHREP